MSRVRQVLGFVLPVVFFTIASWGFLFALLLVVSLFRPLELGQAFLHWVGRWSLVVAGAFATFAALVLRKIRRLERKEQDRGEAGPHDPLPGAHDA